MAKTILFLLLFGLLGVAARAQFQQVSQGQGYANSVFYDLKTEVSTVVSLTDWDIAFGVDGFSSAVFLNEGVASSQAAPPPQLELYVSSATDFASADTADITDRIYNQNLSWDAGAFNSVATPGDPFDLGWGSYSPATQTVLGTRIFFLLGRDSVMRKMEILSLISGSYTFRYATLDGSEADTVTISKDSFSGKTLAFFSFENGILDLEPDSWDLWFTRYVTPLDDGEGNILDYTVTGVLQREGTRIAQLDGVDPETVAVPTVDEAYSDSMDVVGYDWKEFSLTTFTWSIPKDRVYFVRRPNDDVFRVEFIDFEGASTGVTTMRVIEEGLLTTNLRALPAFAEQASLFPNPARETTQLVLDYRHNGSSVGLLEIRSYLGQLLPQTRRTVDLITGRNQFSLPVSGLPAGRYLVQLRVGDEVLTRPLIIR